MELLKTNDRIFNRGDQVNSATFGTIIAVEYNGGKSVYTIEYDHPRFEGDTRIGKAYAYEFTSQPNSRFITEETYRSQRKEIMAKLHGVLTQKNNN